jgi:hypothetical protein
MEYLPCSLTGNTNIVKMAVIPKAIYRLIAILMKNLNAILHRKAILNFILKHKRPNSQSNPEQKCNGVHKAQLQIIL